MMLSLLGRWRVVLDTGAHLYEEHTRTGNRRIRQYNWNVYQPRDERWIETGVFSEPPKPPKKMSPTG